jgi:nicotinamidase-related amidase
MESARPFLEYVDGWLAGLARPPLADLAAPPEATAVVSVDMINGFCHSGPLASPRVKALIPPIVNLLTRARQAGVRDIALTQDTHEPEAVEFGAYPPHCVRGTAEAETIPEFKSLPFLDQMTVIEKNSISSSLETGLEAWIADRPALRTFLVVGDCTDLCVYQLAMHLRLQANARQLERRVIVPADCVDTYDLPVETARSIGAVPHDGELLHRLFLYSMMLNGIEVVGGIA